MPHVPRLRVSTPVHWRAPDPPAALPLPELPPIGALPLAPAQRGMSLIDVRRDRRSAEPLVIGHRGIASQAPENTLASYRKALELGIRIVECDVHLTADGVPVVIHDADVARTTGHHGKVSALTLREIQQLDAGRWKGAEFEREPIPTLEQLLALTRDRAALIIEIKAPGMEQAVVDAMHRAGVGAEGVIIFAWNVDTLDRIRALDPDLTTTLLVKRPPTDPTEREALFQLARTHDIPILGVENRDLDREFFRSAHDAGLDAWVWTVNDPENMIRLRDQGADGIISDCPDVVARVLHER